MILEILTLCLAVGLMLYAICHAVLTFRWRLRSVLASIVMVVVAVGCAAMAANVIDMIQGGN